MRNKIIILLALTLILASNNTANAQIQSERGILALDPQLESVNKQIEDLRNQQVPSQPYEPSNVFEEERANDSKKLGYIIASILVIFLVGGGLYNFTRPQNIEERRKRREEQRIERQENERINLEKLELKRQERESVINEKKGTELAEYIKLRKDIEAMPEYEHWRQAVFKERGRKCSRCGSTENLEIDHRFKSFYAIIKEYGITNANQAYECPVLWSVDNGAPLCKTHHDETTNSIYRQLKMSINKI